MLRVLHTSDWHLGQHLHDHDRTAEHERFLAWLARTIADERIDSLLVAGDVFDTANPSAEAQRAFYGFLARLRDAHRALDVVVIGGNHDSAARLDAPGPLLDALRIRVVGGIPRKSSGELDLDRLVVPLHDASGVVAAYVAAVPFLRPVDVRRGDDGDLIAGVRALYGEVLADARARCHGAESVLAMGHCYMVGGEVSDLSERRVLGGGQNALPADVFGDDVAYVALGHLHKPQRVGGRDHVRYSGAPIAMSLPEFDYKHAVTIVDVADGRAVSIRALPIPRSALRICVPGSDAAEIATIEGLLAVIDDADVRAGTMLPPFVEVRVRLVRPEPALRHRIATALGDRRVRLARIETRYTGTGDHAVAMAGTDLRALSPEQVFERRYRADHAGNEAGNVPAEYIDCFRELMDALDAQEPT